MKSDVQTLEPTKVKVSVEVPYAELKPSIDHAFKHIAEQINVPGFRPGKAPARIVEQRVGRPAILEHAINDGLGKFYSDAVREHELRPIGRPEIDVTQIPELHDENGELHFTAEVEVRPEIELPALDSLTVTVDSASVTDADVDEALDSLRERFGSLVGVDRPAATGDYVVLDLSADVDDENVDTVSSVSYQIGSGNMIDGLDEALDGLSADETTTFETTLMGGEHEGSKALVTVKATSVKERELPEADDDFAQMASEFDTLEELREDLAKQEAERKAGSQAVAARDALINQFLDTIEIPVPAGVVEAEVHDHLEREGRLEDDEHRAEVIIDATKAVQRQILLDTLAESLEVKVGQSELVDFLVNASRQYGMNPNEFISQIDQSGQMPGFVAEVARNKSVVVALRQVSVVDSDGNEVDLSAHIGSDSDDAAAEDAFQAAQQAAALADES